MNTGESDSGRGRDRPNSSNASSSAGGLNFVFESGSGVRTGGRSVRSQAAKHGWTSRNRAPKGEGQSKPKRRKIQHELTYEGLPLQPPPRVDSAATMPSYYLPHQDPLLPAYTAHGQFPQYTPPTPPTSSSDIHIQPKDKPATQSVPDGTQFSQKHSSLPSPPLSPCENIRQSEVCDDEQTTLTQATLPSPARRSTTPFLHVVMNEDYPICTQVDHAGNPFAAFPVDWKPFYGNMVEHYRAITYKQVQEINSDPDFGACVCELPLQTTISEREPALFFALMSTTAVMLLKSGKTLEITPQWFQSKTVETLNEAISDPTRAFSSATILAVTLIALFESTRGAPDIAASLHQPALRKMVDARGGLDVLFNEDARGPALVRFLVWCDRVISSQSGNQLVFSEWDDETMSATRWNGIWTRMSDHLDKGNGELEDREVIELAD